MRIYERSSDSPSKGTQPVLVLPDPFLLGVFPRGLPGWLPILVASVGPFSPPVPKGRECTYALSESSSTWHAGARRMHMHMC